MSTLPPISQPNVIHTDIEKFTVTPLGAISPNYLTIVAQAPGRSLVLRATQTVAEGLLKELRGNLPIRRSRLVAKRSSKTKGR
jgi:hypothetical protein